MREQAHTSTVVSRAERLGNSRFVDALLPELARGRVPAGARRGLP